MNIGFSGAWSNFSPESRPRKSGRVGEPLQTIGPRPDRRTATVASVYQADTRLFIEFGISLFIESSEILATINQVHSKTLTIHFKKYNYVLHHHHLQPLPRPYPYFDHLGSPRAFPQRQSFSRGYFPW